MFPLFPTPSWSNVRNILIVQSPIPFAIRYVGVDFRGRPKPKFPRNFNGAELSLSRNGENKFWEAHNTRHDQQKRSMAR